MKRGFLFFVLALFAICLVWPSASVGLPKLPSKDLPSTALSPTLQVKTPAAGENWALGSKHDITWTSSNINGNLRIDLFCDLPSPHKVGTITGNTAVSNGKYNWDVGKFLGGAVKDQGKNYRIVLTATNPSLTKSSPLFNLTPASSQLNPPLLTGIKKLTLTYPRRGDAFHKGMRYTITWQSVNLNNARLKLELFDNDEVTLRQTIADNFENKGKMDWDVPMTLPDEEKRYKIKLQTMDGAQKDIVGPIRISKGTTQPASLKVTNPITGDKNFGDTIRVKWTSTAACSGNAGPRDAGFRIELVKLDDKDHTKIIARETLTDQGFVFDNEKPSGYLNWHWDWVVEPGSCQYGTYEIYVTSLTAKEGCDGYSQIFRIYDPKALKEIGLPATIKNRKPQCNAERYSSDNQQPTCPTYTAPTAPRGWVGSEATFKEVGGFIAASENETSYTQLRSEMTFPGLGWTHIKNKTVKKATLIINISQTSGNWGGFCGKYLKAIGHHFIADVHSTSLEEKRIDVTFVVKGWMSGSIPNKGFELTPFLVPPGDNNKCITFYTAKLYLDFE